MFLFHAAGKGGVLFGLSGLVSSKTLVPESGTGSTGTAQAMVNLRVYVNFGGEQAAKVGEMIHTF